MGLSLNVGAQNVSWNLSPESMLRSMTLGNPRFRVLANISTWVVIEVIFTLVSLGLHEFDQKSLKKKA